MSKMLCDWQCCPTEAGRFQSNSCSIQIQKRNVQLEHAHIRRTRAPVASVWKIVEHKSMVFSNIMLMYHVC